MLADRIALLSSLLHPSKGVSADTQHLQGTLTITADSPADPVGATVVDSQGLEESINEHILPLTVPVFVNATNGDSNGGAQGGGSDTLVTLTNNTSRPLENITLTLRDPSGTATLATKTIGLDAHATVAIFLSDLLPQ